MRRYVRPTLFGIVVLLVLAIPAAAVLARSYILAPTAMPAKDQPIDFPHTVHVQTVRLDCTYCHRTAETSPDAGVPALEICMGCHAVIPTDNRPELQTLVNAFEEGIPVEWNRIHQMPDHVHFVHSMHIDAGFDCATCHGDVGSMEVVEQVRDLRMGDCIDCHRENDARTDCSVCHY